ncbi:MAG: hypothetical protein R2697_07685 [Ilumatobacteraceae bacterium]
MLTGPIGATQKLLDRTGLSIDDIDIFEVQRGLRLGRAGLGQGGRRRPRKTRQRRKRCALGHPLGGTGAFLMTKALNELERTGGKYGLVSMCCGGGLGTGTIIERIETTRRLNAGVRFVLLLCVAGVLGVRQR